MEKLIIALASLIDDLTQSCHSSNQSCVFNAYNPPSITIEKYLLRIVKYLEASESTLIVSFILMKRFCSSTSLKLTNFNVHRIVFASFLTASKFNLDSVFSNKYFAKVAGVCMKELNKLEVDFLSKLRYNLWIKEEEYQTNFEAIEQLMSSLYD